MKSLQRLSAPSSSVIAVALFFSAIHVASAATDTWSSSPSGVLWNSTDWTGGNAPPQAGDALVFGTSSQTTLNNNFSPGTAFDGIYFTGNGFILNGSSVLLSGSAVSNTVGVMNNSGLLQTFGLPLTLDRGYYSFSSISGGSLALNGGLTLSAGGVAFFDLNNTSTGLSLDTGTGLISGLENSGLIYDGNFTPTGLATISGGSIIAYPTASYVSLASGTIPSVATNNLFLSATGSAITYSTPANPVANTVTVGQAGTATGTATTTLSVPVTSTLTLGANGGIYVLNSQGQAKATFTLTGGPVTAGTSGPGTIVFAVNGTTPSNQVTIASAIVNNAGGGAVTAVTTGPGSILFGTSTSNNYTGGTYVTQGQLQVGKTNGAGFGPIYVSTNASIYFQNAGIYPNNNFFLSPGFGSPTACAVANGGALLYGTGPTTNGGTITLMGAPVTSAPGVRFTPNASSTYTFTGQITGTGTLEISGVSSFSDFVEIRNSTASPNNWQGGLIIDPVSLSTTMSVRVGANNQIPNGAGAGNLTIIAPGDVVGKTVRFDVNGHTATINGLIAPNNGNSMNQQVGAFQASGTLTLGAGNANGDFFGELTNTSPFVFNLVKIGTGTQILEGVNTYTGTTTISNGVLALNGSGSIANTPTISISAPGTLDATGAGGMAFSSAQTLGCIGTVNGSSSLSGVFNPFFGTIGGFTNNGNLTINGGSTYVWSVNNATTGTAGADPGWSLVNLTGGGQLNISASPVSTIKIKITSLNSLDQPGNATFNAAVSQTWLILQSTTPVQNFNAQDFIIDTSAFSNLPGGAASFSVANTTPSDSSGNNLYLVYTATPAISTALVNQTDNAGSTATFTVVANGATPPITFNWTQGGNPLFSGGFSASGGAVTITTNSHTSVLSIANVQDPDGTTNGGGPIAVSVSDTFGNSGVSSATLTVIDPPTGTPTVTQSGTLDNSLSGPSDAGGRTYLTGVQSTGTQPLSYQWYLGANAIIGGTNPVLAINVSQAAEGNYTLVVSNQAGGVISSILSIGPVLSIANQMIYEPFQSYLQVPNTQPYPGTFLGVSNIFNQLTGEPCYWTNFGTSGFAGILSNGLAGSGENQFGGTYPPPGIAGDSTNELYWNDNNENYHLRVTTNGPTLFAVGGADTNIYFSCTMSIVSLGSGSFDGMQDVIAGFCSSNGSTAFNLELCVSNISGAGNACAIGIAKGNGTTTGNPVSGTVASPLTNVVWTSSTQSPLGNELWVQQSLFVIGRYQVVDGPGGSNDTVTLWINPPESSFFAATPPAPLLGPVAFTNVPNSVVQDFAIHGSTTPASHRITDLRIGTTWASVTPPNGPTLDIAYSAPNTVITWSTNWPGYVLEQTPSVSPTSWTTNSLPPYTVVGGNNVVTTSATGKMFYRLKHP